MVRILLPKHAFSSARIALVERTVDFQHRTWDNVNRLYAHELNNKKFLEGFVDDAKRVQLIADMLADDNVLVANHHLDDTLTWLIENCEDVEGW